MEYLDLHGKQKNNQHIDFIITNSIIEKHFLHNKLQDKPFTGKSPAPAPASMLTKIDLSYNFFYDNYSKSIWNTISTQTQVDSAYSIWQKEHEATFLFKPIVVPKTKKTIDVSVNTISDVLDIIQQHEYEEEKFDKAIETWKNSIEITERAKKIAEEKILEIKTRKRNGKN